MIEQLLRRCENPILHQCLTSVEESRFELSRIYAQHFFGGIREHANVNCVHFRLRELELLELLLKLAGRGECLRRIGGRQLQSLKGEITLSLQACRTLKRLHGAIKETARHAS